MRSFWGSPGLDRRVADLFDPEYYYEQLIDRGIALRAEKRPKGEDLLFHYVSKGWKLGLAPSSKTAKLLLRLRPAKCEVCPLLLLVHGESFSFHEKTCEDDSISIRLAAVVNDKYYRDTYFPDTQKPFDSARHFEEQGCSLELNPNEFINIKFVKSYYALRSLSAAELLAMLEKPLIFHPLISNPCSYYNFLDAVNRLDEEEICGYLAFDYKAYVRDQADLAALKYSNIARHLFAHGLKENRLRNGGFLDEFFLPWPECSTDFELIQSLDRPLKYYLADASNRPSGIDGRLEKRKVGIGIVAWKNSTEQIIKILKSVQANSGSDSCELIACYIYDNSPGELDWQLIGSLFPSLILNIFSDINNPGFGIGHNHLIGTAFADGIDYYIGANPDGFFLPGALVKVIQFAATKKDGKILELNTEPLPHPKWFHPDSGETDWASGVCFLIDKIAFQLTGGFDPSFPMYGEDVDLSFRAATLGVGIYVTPFSAFYHDTLYRAWESAAEVNSRRIKMLIGQWYLCVKWGNKDRARDLLIAAIKSGFDPSLLPPAPVLVKDSSNQFIRLLGSEHFARVFSRKRLSVYQ